ncbi:L,D-transpeptidase [Salinarimonas soli]|uniref:L,D-transpeptidase n=1 Tax=Salinarimonas soli TaxID=1638099 RepID=A0A5B2V8E9_9HYPH|nr:L,D-transpeptidase [Salinarimonas soli]KAA2234730.1 L,D-transpeptidase [Salinarimonas soli]
MTRRALLPLLAAGLAAPAAAQPYGSPIPDDDLYGDPAAPPGAEDWYVDAIPDRPFDVPVVDLSRLHPSLRRQRVEYEGPGRPGGVVIDTGARFLYFVGRDGTALRYGIGVGRQGFSWSGTAEIRRKARWPSWRPPATMLRRRPDLPPFMKGGLDNPLGARALYLYQGGRDTLYRIHGTNEPWSIGQAVSSGCIRLLNQDIYDLYERVGVGTPVTVLAGTRRRGPVEPDWES